MTTKKPRPRKSKSCKKQKLREFKQIPPLRCGMTNKEQHRPHQTKEATGAASNKETTGLH
jgi:hypothetical protein